MTEHERALLVKLAQCYNDFAALPDKHPSDMDDVVFHVHALQRILMARSAVRNEPGFFTKDGPGIGPSPDPGGPKGKPVNP